MGSTINSLSVISMKETDQDRFDNTGVGRHVVLIRPAMVSSVGTWSSPVTPPLGIAYLAAMLQKAGAEVTCIDAIGEKVDQIIQEGNYVYQGLSIDEILERIPSNVEVIGISCMFSQDWIYFRNLLHATRERFPKTLIVVGGEHITALPEFSLRDCPAIDVCILGEGEETIVDVVNRARDKDAVRRTPGVAFLDEAGNYVQAPPRERIKDVDQIPYPAWDLFPMDNFVDTHNGHGVYRGKTMGIIATRGCPYKCTFCSNPTMYGKAYVPRSPGDVLDEIEFYQKKYNATNIDFYDLTMILKKQWVLEFCKEIERRGMSFTWQLPTGTRSEVVDDDVAPWLFKTGCRNITYAPESGDPETLDKIKKRVHLPALISSIRASLKAGINVKCNIIIGFPHERRINVMRTMWFCGKLAWVGVHDVGVFLFSPYPGSQLFRELQQDGMIPQKLDDAYFNSLVNFMDPTSTEAFSKHLSGRELAFWRFFGMAYFFALSYMFRPWRFIQFVRNVWNYESNTVLEQRVGAMIERFRITKKKAPETAPTGVPATQAGA
ncbi:B12-binding domain-containing radical SAM protein [bacterium]|nr:B12-binding domain-containing radical SAM protein [bacterium]